MYTQPDPQLYARIYELARQIPSSFVTSYGDMALMIGGGCEARTIGEALRALTPATANVPWQRIVARDGSISTRGLEQRRLLEDEGVQFDRKDRVNMARHRWAGPSAEWAADHGIHPLPTRDDPPEQLELF